MGLRGTASHDIAAENVRILKDEALIIPTARLRAALDARHRSVTSQRNCGCAGHSASWVSGWDSPKLRSTSRSTT